jgi:hypothetical protein
MGQIRLRPSSRPACTVLAWPSLLSACGPQLLRQWPTAVRSGSPGPRGARGTLDGGMHARWCGDFTDAGG